MAEHPRDYVAAHHEAGHAVGAYMLEVPTQALSIYCGESGEGHWKPVLTISEIRKRDLWRQHAICGELGRTVERLLFGSFEPCFCEDDQEIIDGLLQVFLHDENEREAFKSSLPKLAEEVTKRPLFFDAVKSLAQELLKGKPLEGPQVISLIEGVIIPQDE